jgi:hypothetical protein
VNEAAQHLEVLSVGAGISGIGMGIDIPSQTQFDGSGATLSVWGVGA